MANLAEAYDMTLSAFLKQMLSGPAMEGTIIVLRSDHGIQAGPITSDYSIQVEALRPWTEIIIPKKFPGLSLGTLFDNQSRLATSFDLYKSIANIISGNEMSTNTIVESSATVATYHLWQQSIPKNRTCAEAGVRADYCVYENQRTCAAPNLRTCNIVEEDQRLVCPQFAEAFQIDMGAVVDKLFPTKTKK